jgi:type IV pilus assembly protein PilA
MIKKLKRGFTLVELMIVVAIVGVLAALAVYGVRKYVSNAKTAEARNNLGRLGKDAAAAWAKEGMAPGILAAGAGAGVSNVLCPNAAAIPADIPKGEKVQSDPKDWKEDAGWSCLKFQVDSPQYYQYEYTITDSTGQFTAFARGNLDGDDTESEFTLLGQVEGPIVKLAPNIGEHNPEE